MTTKTTKKLIAAQRMADLLQLLKLSYGVGTRKSIDSVLKEWAEANE